MTNLDKTSMEDMHSEQLDESSEIQDLEDAEREQKECMRIPPWNEQITLRGIVISVVIGIMYGVIATKLNLTTGMIPNLNSSVALVAYWSLKFFTVLIGKTGWVVQPFTQQENTMMQSCVVASFSLAYGGGFGSYLLSLNRRTYLQAGVDTPGNTAITKEPGFGWMTSFLLLSSFVGLFALIPLTKYFITNPNLPFPTGTATAVLINGFHSREGDHITKDQVRGFKITGVASFVWAFFQWFYSGGEKCGFSMFPTFGLKALKKSFNFDFSMTYVGSGMICSHRVNLSLLFGAILSWGIMWPMLNNLKGHWYAESIPQSSLQSLNGYKVFFSIALIIGDGLYAFVKTSLISFLNMIKTKTSKLRVSSNDENHVTTDNWRDDIFIKDTLPNWVAFLGYMICSFVAVIAISQMFPPVKWYFVVLVYIVAPLLSFCNAYGAGLTDMNICYHYGKIALVVFCALAGKKNGVVVGLVTCGLIKTILNVSCNLMQDFKTGHLTLTSPKSIFVSQFIGTAIGCVLAPSIFMVFYKSFDVGNPDGEYKAPYAIVFRNMAILVVEGFSVLPLHCLQICYGLFAFAILANLIRDLSPEAIGDWIPLPMAMAVPFQVGANFTIDMCLGTLVKFLWHRLELRRATFMVPAIASGFICGDGLWTLSSSLLSLFKVKPPMCMSFSPRE